MNRIHRGFHRVGIVLAVPFLILAAGIALQQTWIGWGATDVPVHPRADGSFSYDEAFPHPHAFYGYALAWAVFAIALYATARAVGWVLDGFVGSGTRI